MLIGIIVVCVLTMFCWIFEIAVDFSKTTNIKSQTSIQQQILNTIIRRSPPIDFAFIYTQDNVQEYNCPCEPSHSHCSTQTYTCYSKTSVTVPIDSKTNSLIYQFNNTPKMFYFTYNQDLNMSVVFKAQFDSILSNINSCDSQNKKITEYYPLNAGTYIVSEEKIPTYLKKQHK